jgi:hypothetical protein
VLASTDLLAPSSLCGVKRQFVGGKRTVPPTVLGWRRDRPPVGVRAVGAVYYGFVGSHSPILVNPVG